MRLMIAWLLVASCASQQAKQAGHPVASSAITGTRADVHLQSGAHRGFAVEDQCREPTCYGVRGSGAHFFPGLRPWDRPLPTEIADQWRAVVLRALAGLSSVHLSGFGAACNDPGLFVWLDDWRQVDTALLRIGAMLAKEDLQETVGVCVMPRTHPVLIQDASRQGCVPPLFSL